MPTSGVKVIPFDSPDHRRILDAIIARYNYSHDRMSEFHENWRRNEETVLAYLPTSENDRIRKQLRHDGSPQYTTIQIPYSYALLLASHSYWSTVFLSRDPVFQYKGRHGESAINEQAVEAVMAYQFMAGEWAMPLYIWLYDAAKYGLGVVCNYWAEEKETVSSIVEEPWEILGVPIPGRTHKVTKTEVIPGYEGNRLFNVRPFDFYPDPRKPVWDLQRSEFCGRVYDENWGWLIRGETDGRFYNLEDVWRNVQLQSNRDEGSAQLKMPFDYHSMALSSNIDDYNKGYVEVLEMYIDLIPADWGLGNRTRPEKWVFMVANEAVIFSAQPLGFYHNKFPFHTIPYELEGYQIATRSLLDITQPLNDTLTWLINSHFFNVRKALNDQFIIDPSRIEMRDVNNPGPGRIWRLKPAAYGTDPKTAFTQVPTLDITRANLQDAQVVGEMMQRLPGTMDNIQGQTKPGGRKTATEMRQAAGFGSSRLKTNAEIMSASGWSKLAQVALQSTQQMYTKERFYRLVGALGERYTQVGPEEIKGFYDYQPVDGTLPADRFAMMSMWKEMFREVMQIPQIAQRYDLGRMFEYVAQLGGMRAISAFRLEIQPDAALAAQAQAGNVVPMQPQGGPPGGRPPGRNTTGSNATGVPGAPNVAGMGPTG